MRALAFSALSLVFAVGCSASSSDPSPETQKSGLPLGRYAFVLDESDVLPKVKASCATEADAAACVRDIEEQASREGIRLSVDAHGHVIWTSYVLEKDGAETVVLEAELDARWDGAALSGTPVAPLAGTQAATSKLPTTLRIDRVDDTTIAMVDARKGRLVFRKQ
jgi:hypothetical protein